MKPCLFCEIASGLTSSHILHEDDKHLAFLDIYPATVGQTVVITKQHRSSYIFHLPEEEYSALLNFGRQVANILDIGLKCQRTCLVMEGMEIEHAHLKLYPIHTVKKSIAEETIDLNEYNGYLCTLHGQRMSDWELAQVAQKILRVK
ncbi:Histidine triad (HIT) protein [Microcystis aeruginosa PCC 9809]|jgi:histidine triad (HIT) family protein|uniref:Histidine triad (HIT) protein n=1 Tax=Microcystis aeruginosa PCC 9809 TaxID=1160285 RepID=I4HL58_MICAE|nr:HIT family protein [Microcystis aeruginosa]CCI22782.1 Histidine triad (HIT) protein [Microcystis aeruginosa PCC 9809]